MKAANAEAVKKQVLTEREHRRIMTVLPYLQEYMAAIVSPSYSAERIHAARKALNRVDSGAKVLCKSIKQLYEISKKRPDTADVTLAVPEHAQHLLSNNIENRSADMEVIRQIGRRLDKAGGIAWLWLALELVPWFDTRDRTAVFMAWHGINSNFSI